MGPGPWQRPRLKEGVKKAQGTRKGGSRKGRWDWLWLTMLLIPHSSVIIGSYKGQHTLPAAAIVSTSAFVPQCGLNSVSGSG